MALALVGAGALAAAANTMKTNTMELHLTVTTPADRILVGTELRVRSVLRNAGADVVHLPAAGQPAPVTFVVRDESGQTLATGRGGIEGRPGAIPPASAWEPVPAGGEVAYDDDISPYLGTVLGAGRYELMAELREKGAIVTSGAVPFTVHPLSPDAVVRVAGLEGAWLSTLVSHRGADGKHTLLYSFADKAIDATGSLRPVLVAPSSSSAPPTLGLVPRALVEPGEAWVGILDGDRLRGGLVSPRRNERLLVPVGIGARGARLLSGGASFGDDGGALLMATAHGEKLAVVRVGPATETTVIEVTAPASLADADRVVSVAQADRGGRVYLCWVEGGHSVRLLSFDPAMPGVAPEPGVLHRATGRVVAIQADPPDPMSPSWVHVVDVSGENGQSVRLTRLNPASGLLVDAAELSAPPVQVERIRRWLLPSWGVSARGPLVVLTEETLWLLRNSAWTKIDVRVADAHSAELIYFRDTLWLSSWSPQTGALLEGIPAVPAAAS